MRLGLIYRPCVQLPRIATVLDTLPEPPPAVNWLSLIPMDGDALGNDDVGDCVECAALRGIQIQRAVVAGDNRKPTKEEALELYSNWSGWDGTQGTDLGTASDVAADKWGSKGIAWGPYFEDVPALALINPQNIQHMKQAIASLGPIQIDMRLPIGWQTEANLWAPCSGQNNATWGYHRTCAARYDSSGLYIVTWGTMRMLPWDAVLGYVVDAYAVATRSWLGVDGRGPTGLTYDGLVQTLKEVAA